MKVAIVCDWLTGTGGAERVVLELHHMFPDAPIYTSQYNTDPKIWFGETWFTDADVRTGWLQHLPKRFKKFLPLLRAWYFSRLNLSDYDLVLSSGGAEAKGVKKRPGAIHINYCHAPTHYYWSRYQEYLASPGFGRLDKVARAGLKLLAERLRRWDLKAATQPDFIIANSTHTKDEIKKYYNREATVIHPPVDVERFNIKSDEPRRGFVIAGRQTPYKKIDLAVQACSQLDLPLLVIGRGPQHKKLVKLAGRSVTFLRNVSDSQMAEYFSSSLAFIFPGIDDFGITALEAMAAGTPVIAYHGGGAPDYVRPGKTGVFFNDQTADSLAKALQDFKPGDFSSSSIVAAAKDFDAVHFRSKMQTFIDQHVQHSR